MADRSPLIAGDSRVRPVRGLIAAHNYRRQPFAVRHLRMWLRYNRQVLNALKVDLHAEGIHTAALGDLLSTAEELDCRLGLRTDATVPPPDLKHLKQRGLWDVMLCPAVFDSTLQLWLDACKAADLTVRLQLLLPTSTPNELEGIAKFLKSTSVREVDFVCSPELNHNRNPDPLGVNQVDAALKLIEPLEALGIRVTLRGVPFCMTTDEHRLHIANSRQNALDHAHYIPTSVTVAQRVHGRGPVMAGKMIRMLLGRHTLSRNPVDEILLPYLIKRSYRYLANRLVRRLTEHKNVMGSVPKAWQRSKYDEAIQEEQELAQRNPQAECLHCRFSRICDHGRIGAKAIPRFTPKRVEGDLIVSPMQFCREQPMHYDAIDAERLERQNVSDELVEEALETLTQQSPTQTLTSQDYKVENVFCEQMEGGLKWWSVTNTEQLSTPLGRFEPPLTISVEVGAGIADYMGFSFGRHCAIVCPMEAYRHTLSLHVNAEGQYVLLRDGKPMQPVEFEGVYHLPQRLGSVLLPQLSIWNIDDCVLTQGLKIWNRIPEDQRAKPKYSIIIVSTKFTRRLQAVLDNLAHQQGIDLALLEVIVAYVPGLDATDDLIDSMQMTYPELRIVRSAFPENKAKAKGLLINESFRLARGEWIMLLDSDTLLPPDYFARMDAVADTEKFIAPDGRRLLTRETTAKVLMGAIKPWEDWERLLGDEGEFRHRETRGIPVGFCQAFRAEYLDKFPYLEVDHFEIADMHFSMDVLGETGKEHRLSGAPVIHLDHGGSQWYGTQKHM